MQKLGAIPLEKTTYVNREKADDSGDGLTPETAKKTIGAATALYSSGERGTIYVTGGIYYEQVTVPKWVKIIGAWDSLSGTSPTNGVVEIRGEEGYTGTQPPLTLMEGATAENVRAGVDSTVTTADCIVDMYNGSNFIKGSTGGINKEGIATVFNLRADGGQIIEDSEISGSHIPGENNGALSLITGISYNARIRKNILTNSEYDMISFPNEGSATKIVN